MSANFNVGAVVSTPNSPKNGQSTSFLPEAFTSFFGLGSNVNANTPNKTTNSNVTKKNNANKAQNNNAAVVNEAPISQVNNAAAAVNAPVVNGMAGGRKRKSSRKAGRKASRKGSRKSTRKASRKGSRKAGRKGSRKAGRR
jgi:colicin import membrane protein